MRPFIFPLLILLLCLSPLSSGAQQVTSRDELVVMPGDLLRVMVWREEDLSGDFTVDVDGAVVFPLLGRHTVTGRPWAEVKDGLLAAYQVELRNPSIELTPFRRINVLGEVNQPGQYPMDPTNTSLAAAVGMAGGTTPQGDLEKLRVIRDGEMILDGIVGELGLAALDIRSGDQIFVGRRGWFDRNSTFLVSAILSVTSIVVTLVAK